MAIAGKDKRKQTWMILAGIVIVGLLYLKFSEPSNQPVPARYEEVKTGAGAVVDFTKASNKVHVAVDEVLKKNSFTIKDSKEMGKEVPRQKVEGVIRWHTRQLLVTVPKELSVETVQQHLQNDLHNAGGQVLLMQPDHYQGLDVVRLDLGFKDKIAGEEITIISDRVYLFKEKDTVAVVPKNEVKGRGQIAIVIDDFGYNKEPIGAFTLIDRPLTFAVLPYHPFSNEAAVRGLSSGHQIILHLPMEPLARAEQSEKITISPSMSDEEIQDITRKAIQNIPGLIGVNNHQGSRATADKRVMKVVLSQLKANSLFFLDSRTNGQSIAAETGRQMGLRTGENELFIDNSDDVSAIKAKLRTAQDMAIRHGSVTVIGHARMNTATAVKEMIPELEGSGVKLVFISQIVK